MDTDTSNSLETIEANIAKYQGMVAAEDDKMLRYKVCNIFFIGPTIFAETLCHNLLNDFVSKTPQTLQIFHQVTSACENQAGLNLI